LSISEDPLDAAIGRDSMEVKPWRRRLTIYHRVAGAFMMIKGLLSWGVITGLGLGTPFLLLGGNAQIATVFFAVIDIVAGVALWLGSSWGATLWLLVAALQVSSGIAFADISGIMVMMTIVETVLVAGYVLVRFKVYEEDRR
jgi:hypothetical protein